MDQCPDEPPALGRSHHDRLCAGHISGISGTAVILWRRLQECAEVARGGKAAPQYQRVLCTVDQLVEVARFETGLITKLGVACRDRLAGLARSERPLRVWDDNTRLVLAHAHGERRQETVSERRLVVGVHRWVWFAGARNPATLQRKSRGRTGHGQFVADNA